MAYRSRNNPANNARNRRRKRTRMSTGRTARTKVNFRNRSPQASRNNSQGRGRYRQFTVEYNGKQVRLSTNPQNPQSGTWKVVGGQLGRGDIPSGLKVRPGTGIPGQVNMYPSAPPFAPTDPECFVAGTKVIMKNGPDKNIEDVKVGDEVLSYNVNTKQLEPKTVTELFTQTHDLKDGDITVKITFDNGTVTHNTIANPFWSKEKGFVAVDEARCNRVHAWVRTTNNNKDVANLSVNDTLYSLNDDNGELEEITVKNIEYVMEENIRTYDIQVEDNHTFFANGILTHNSGGGGGDCFNRTSTVDLENGDTISISELEIGDKVKTINKNGEIEYSEVYAWFHKSYDDFREDYINVKTEDNTLTITPEHRIFVNGKDSAASDIKVGDTVSGQKVISVDTATEYGKYAPCTKNGFIMIDNINCSCYAFYSHNFCHIMVSLFLKPIVKIFPSLGSWIGDDGINKIAAPFMKHRMIGKLIGER